MMRKTDNILSSWLFIAIWASIMFLLNACERDIGQERIPFPETVLNRDGAALVKQLMKQPVAYDEFLRLLEGEEPLYEYVQQLTHTYYGFCYFIPYGKKQVRGAIFYPINADLQKDDSYRMDGELGIPDKITAYRLNKEIPLTKRFLYSILFKKLYNHQLDVDPELLEMANKLNGKVISIPIEESSIEIVPTKTVNGSRIEFELRYILHYIGEDYSAVWGISERQMRWFLSEAMGVLGCRLGDSDIRYISPNTLRFAVPIGNVPITPQDMSSMIMAIKMELNRILYLRGFVAEQFYEYRIVYEGNISVGGGSGGMGGGAGMGGSDSGSEGGNESDNKPQKTPVCEKCKQIYEKCECLVSLRVTVLNKNGQCKVGETLTILVEIFGRRRDEVDIVSLEATKNIQGEDWQPFGYEKCNGYSMVMTRTMSNPGGWLLRAGFQPKTTNVTIYDATNITCIAVLCPDVEELKNNATVIEKLQKLWKKGVDFAEENKATHAVREFGAFIIRSPDGEIACREVEPGPVYYLTKEGIAASMTFKYEYEVSNDPKWRGPLIVGTMHVHYPLTWAKSGYSRVVGPSPQDDSPDQIWPVLVCDYTNKVFAGDPVENLQNPLKIWTCGPKRYIPSF